MAQLIVGIVIAAVAVYGAILSTLTFRIQRRGRRPRIKVTVTNGFFTNAVAPPISDPMLQLSAANTGERPVTLSSFGFKLPDGRSLAILEPKGVNRFPLELLSGRSCMVSEEMRVMAGSLSDEGFVGRVKLIGFYRDQVGTEYVSEPWDLDINEWRREAS